MTATIDDPSFFFFQNLASFLFQIQKKKKRRRRKRRKNGMYIVFVTVIKSSRDFNMYNLSVEICKSL